MSSVEQIEHFTGTGLYDKSFIDVLRNLGDPTPFLRGIVAELGPLRKDVFYTQANRRAGVTHNNWYTLYDAAIVYKGWVACSYDYRFLLCCAYYADGIFVFVCETHVVGQLPDGNCSYADWNIFYRLDTTVFYRSARRIYSEYKCQGYA